ncbi:MAG TPA: caspase family protein [Candidatus Deferrimicrobium sp.]|nr:caspase family protein [Candidatus Deferrimicrobium sp.]
MANYRLVRNGDERIFWPGIIILLFILTFHCPIGAVSKHGLLIGIDDYKISGLENLKGTENDLQLIKDVLLNNLGFQEQEITVLKNKNATHSGLEKAFSQLAEKINNGDFVYIHYCGHGSQTLDNDGDEYPGLYDQTWVPYGSRSDRMEGKDCYDITDDELHQWLLPIFNKTEHVVIVSDSCYSAGVTRGNILSARSVSPDLRHYPSIGKIVVKKDFADGIIIGAAQDDELAFEAIFDGKIHGLFSWYWLDSLKKSRPGDTWSDLFQRTYIMVSNYFDQQHPQFQGDADKPVFEGDIKKTPPRIPISRVWRNGHEVQIEAGSLSGVCVGSKFRLYNPFDANNIDLPLLEITKVTPFFSQAITKEPFKFKIGDLVIEERNAHSVGMMVVFFALKMPLSVISGELRLLMPHIENIIRANWLEKLVPPRPFNVNLSITLWVPTKKPEKEGEVYLELQGNKEWFKKQAVFNPAEIEERQVFPVGSLLSFQIKNNSRRDCYIYLLDIIENGGAEAVFPNPGECRQKALLPAGCELDLKNIVFLLLEQPGRKVIKCIATEAPLDMAFLAQASPLIEGRGLKKHWGTIQFSITIDKKR